ncbi:hypothetical protein ACHAWF_007964 [Thalassiosira exigua]
MMSPPRLPLLVRRGPSALLPPPASAATRSLRRRPFPAAAAAGGTPSRGRRRGRCDDARRGSAPRWSPRAMPYGGAASSIGRRSRLRPIDDRPPFAGERFLGARPLDGLCSSVSARRISQLSPNDDDGGDDGPTVAEEEEVLPDGAIRRWDMFEEPVTFVRDLDGRSISTRSPPPPASSSSSSPPPTARSDEGGGSEGGPRPLLPSHVADPLSSHDGLALCVVSRGSATVEEGNDGDGPEARASHASAKAWAEALRAATEWHPGSRAGRTEGGDAGGSPSESVTVAPMLAVASAAPVLAQGGSRYLNRIDKLLEATVVEGAPPPSLRRLAERAVSFRDAVLLPPLGEPGGGEGSDPVRSAPPRHLLTPRERWHLHALSRLLEDDHRSAMGAYLCLLESHPGDLMGLSLALDVAHALGDADAALRAATNVASYWTDRTEGALTPREYAGSVGASLVAAGLAPSSRSTAAAERLAETALARDVGAAGGAAVWALAHALGGEGRSSEAVSKLAGYDGAKDYEGCGHLHFRERMGGYGGIAALDQRRAGADGVARRLYDNTFGRALEYSGNDVAGLERGGEEVVSSERRVPRSVKRAVTGAVGSMFAGLFGGGGTGGGDGANRREGPSADSTQEHPVPAQEERKPKRSKSQTIEDVLTWLPPSPLLLAHATALLFRLTLCEGVKASDQRWADLHAAWTVALKGSEVAGNVPGDDGSPIEYMPLAMLASSLLIEPDKVHRKEVSRQLHCAMEGMRRIGTLLGLGRPQQPSDDLPRAEEWREALRLLAQAREGCARWEAPDGPSSATYAPPERDAETASFAPYRPIAYDFDLRQFLEHASCYAAMEAGDRESLNLARAMCGEGTALRSNCPELWWRYGAILDLMGDEVAAENARAASVSLGSGEGGNTVAF